MREQRFTLDRLLLVAIPAVCAGVLLHRFAGDAESLRIRGEFDTLARLHAVAIQEELADVEQSMLAVRALLEGQDTFDRGAFGSLVTQLGSKRRSILAMHYAEAVGDAQVAEFERAASALAGAPVVLRPIEGTGSDAPELHHPVLLSVPHDETPGILGVDLSSCGVRRAAIVAATRSRRVALTQPIPLVENEARGPAAVAVLGVRDPRGGVDARGILCTPICYTTLVTAALSRHSGVHGHVAELRLRDASIPGHPMTVFGDSEHAMRDRAPAAGDPECGTMFHAGGRTFVLDVVPTPEFLSERSTGWPLVLGIVGCIVTAVGVVALFANAARIRFRRELRVRTMVDAAWWDLGTGIVLLDARGIVCDGNAAARRILGTSGGSLQWALDEWRVGHEPDALGATIRDLLVLPVLERRVVATKRVVGPRQGGHDLVWLELEAGPVATGAGPGCWVLVRDLTEERRAGSLGRMLQAALLHATEPVHLLDRAGKILWVNKAFEACSGYPAAESVGRSPRLMRETRMEPELQRQMWDRLLGGEVFRAPCVHRRRSGAEQRVELTIVPVPGSPGEVPFYACHEREVRSTEAEDRRSQLALAEGIHRLLHPRMAPVLRGLDLSFTCRPAAAVGGDFCDFVHLDQGRIAIVLGDACGHGVGPAALALSVRACLRTLLRTGCGVEEAVRRLDLWVRQDLGDGGFVTLFVAVLDPRERLLHYVSAGHTPCHLLDDQGVVREVLGSTGSALGIDDEPEHRALGPIHLQEGDVLACSTDGLHAVRNIESVEYGADRMLDAIRSRVDKSASSMVSGVEVDIERFAGPGRYVEDDEIVVVCRVVPRRPGIQSVSWMA